MIVVDTNIVAYAYIQGDHTKLAHRVQHLDPQWRLPTLWRHEFLNILSVYVEHGGCHLDRAIGLWQHSVENLSSCEHVVDMISVLKIASEHKITAYDAQFIVLAQALNVLCVTEDKLLLRKFPTTAISMSNFCQRF